MQELLVDCDARVYEKSEIFYVTNVKHCFEQLSINYNFEFIELFHALNYVLTVIFQTH